MNQRCRIILAPDVTRDQIDDAMVRHGWQLTQIVPASDQLPYQLIYATGDGRAWLHLIEDRMLGVAYFEVTGSGVSEAEEQVKSSLGWVSEATRGEALASVDPDQLLLGLAWLAALGPHPASSEEHSALERARVSSEPTLEQMARLCLVYLGRTEAGET